MFVKVETMIPPSGKSKTVIINTDKILCIQKDVSAGSYLVTYDTGNDSTTPRFFDRYNAEIIFRAIGARID